MAIVKMKRISVIGMNYERKKLIEYLQSVGTLDVSESKSEELMPRDTAGDISRFESAMAQAQTALDILAPFANRKSGLFFKRSEMPENTEDTDKMKGAALARDVIKTDKTISDLEDKKAKLMLSKSMLVPYTSLDASIETSLKNASVKVGTLEGAWDSDKLWQELMADGIEAVHFEILSSSKEQTAVWFIYHKTENEKLSKVFARINLVTPKVNLNSQKPEVMIESIEKEEAETEKEIDALKAKIKSYAENIGEIELYYDKLSVRRDKYKALSEIGLTKNTFYIKGYVPEKGAEELKEKLQKDFTVSVELVTPSDDEDVPKAFSNNAFVSPVEGITSDYSMPSAIDIDPNPIMSFFYYFFFGMMFSDAGYGLLMMIGCGLLAFTNLIEKEKRRTYKMFFMCGVFTTFWGIMYGSFFGDMIATVSKTFGEGKLAFTPILMDPVKKPLELLIMSVAFGLIHILFAIGIKFYMTWREGDRWGAIFDSGFWFGLLLSIAVFAAGMGLSLPVVQKVGMYLMIAFALGLVLTQGRSSKNPVMKFFNGVLSLYDITSYVGDLLSYSRLMALGLATGVIATVINVLGSLGGNSITGLIGFIVISLFGHALNFAINMLGAYVHTNRLQYVEFYQKFYEGGGRKYKPLSFNTKYFKFKKKEN
ncbi:MAG: V-type ATP synthase subunit I [Clostridia bacterium]|nr:V-type ATP synthase subunit I [Clostridia bacterium]